MLVKVGTGYNTGHEESLSLDVFHSITREWLSTIFSQCFSSRGFMGQWTIWKLFGSVCVLYFRYEHWWIDLFNDYEFTYSIKGTVEGTREVTKRYMALALLKRGVK